MKRNHINTIFALVIIVIFSSCRKVCTDPNSDNFNPKKRLNSGKCLYRYLRSIEVNYFPHQYQSGNAWDTTITHNLDICLDGESPSAYLYQTTINSNSVLFTPSNKYAFKLWNDIYNYELCDINAGFSDIQCNDYIAILPYGGVIASGTINPLESGSDGKILINSTNGTVITINYEVLEE